MGKQYYSVSELLKLGYTKQVIENVSILYASREYDERLITEMGFEWYYYIDQGILKKIGLFKVIEGVLVSIYQHKNKFSFYCPLFENGVSVGAQNLGSKKYIDSSELGNNIFKYNKAKIEQRLVEVVQLHKELFKALNDSYKVYSDTATELINKGFEVDLKTQKATFENDKIAIYVDLYSDGKYTIREIKQHYKYPSSQLIDSLINI